MVFNQREKDTREIKKKILTVIEKYQNNKNLDKLSMSRIALELREQGYEKFSHGLAHYHMEQLKTSGFITWEKRGLGKKSHYCKIKIIDKDWRNKLWK